jgi:hypothetical protein
MSRAAPPDRPGRRSGLPSRASSLSSRPCPSGYPTRRPSKRERCSGHDDGVRHRFASTPPCAKSGSSPPQARSHRLKGIVDLSPTRVGGDARRSAYAAKRDDESRLSTPVTGLASRDDDEPRRGR